MLLSHYVMKNGLTDGFVSVMNTIEEAIAFGETGQVYFSGMSSRNMRKEKGATFAYGLFVFTPEYRYYPPSGRFTALILSIP